MQQPNDYKSLTEYFLTPARESLSHCSHTRECPELDDWQWIRMGVNRSINDERSGRSFLQDWAMSDESSIGVGHFFETLKSSRRLQLIEEVNTTLAGSMPSHPDSLIDTLEELGGIDIYAGDGHYHAAGVHDAPIKGKRRAVGHFYTLNYRTHALTHLTAADLQGGRKKSEHDMHALKRMSSGQLRQGAAKGRQVLYVWDCAGTDMRQWYKWKQAAGVYFLSRAKDLMKITCYGEIEFDREDPINAGVLADQHAATETTGVMMRYIRYQCPRTGTEYEFITNHMKIRPGVVAWLYLRRWDIEKTYDTFKNKLSETKAWASSPTAKKMQAQFLCLAHNLMVLLECDITGKHGIINHQEIRRCEKRDAQARRECNQQNRPHSPLLFSNPHRRSQLTLKFIRWLRHHLRVGSLIYQALQSLRQVYATF